MAQELAAALLAVPGLIPETHRQKSAKFIRSLIDFHHDPITVSDGGSNEPHNLTPLLKAVHKEETRKKTVPIIAKNKRIRKDNARHKAEMAKKVGLSLGDLIDGQNRLAACRLLAAEAITRKPKRKMQSRGFQGSRSFKGEIRWKSRNQRKDP